MNQSSQKITSWGGVTVDAREKLGEGLEQITRSAALSRGLGRSYGDSSLPASRDDSVACSVLGDRILAFDRESGILLAEAGLSVQELNRLFLRERWFVPVTPGTQFVTLGGCVASDVHGKNHHVNGCFGAHVTRLKIRTPREIVWCSPEIHPDLFRATIGGMGLTGHILEVEFRMERIASPWILQESFRVKNIDAYVDALKESAENWPYTVGWIDCLTTGASMGRGILQRGRWAEPGEASAAQPSQLRRISLPAIFPSWTINDFTVRIFNWLYYWKQQPAFKRGLIHPEKFFYPLDAILHWNRVYGKAGFTQYQCVLPESAGRGAARRFLDVLTRRGGASFLCVIKDCGAEGQGVLSFPFRGISIAIDFAVRPDTASLVAELNEFVIAEGGRIYLTKDTFTTPEHFARMEPRLGEFQAIRRQWDPNGELRSAQSRRLGLE